MQLTQPSQQALYVFQRFQGMHHLWYWNPCTLSATFEQWFPYACRGAGAWTQWSTSGVCGTLPRWSATPHQACFWRQKFHPRHAWFCQHKAICKLDGGIIRSGVNTPIFFRSLQLGSSYSVHSKEDEVQKGPGMSGSDSETEKMKNKLIFDVKSITLHYNCAASTYNLSISAYNAQPAKAAAEASAFGMWSLVKTCFWSFQQSGSRRSIHYVFMVDERDVPCQPGSSRGEDYNYRWWDFWFESGLYPRRKWVLSGWRMLL